MKTTKLKNLCLTFLICVFVINALTHTLVHAAQTIPGVQRLAEGIAAYEHGEYDDAIFKLEMAVYQIPEEEKDQLWKAHLYLGLSYHLAGDNDEAKNEFIKANSIIKSRVPDPVVHSPKIVTMYKETIMQTGTGVSGTYTDTEKMEKQLYGKWINKRETESYDFLDNGTVTIVVSGQSRKMYTLHGHYKIVEADRIKIDFRGDATASQMPPRYFKISISENAFSLTDEPKKKGGPDGPTTKYNRVE